MTSTIKLKGIALQDLPKNYQLLLPPPIDFRDEHEYTSSPVMPTITTKSSIATGTDDEMPDGYFIHASDQNDIVTSEEKGTELPSFHPSDLRRGDKSYRSIGQVVSDDPTNLHADLSTTTVCSESSSMADDFDVSIVPNLPKYFIQQNRSKLRTAELKSLQISTLLTSCQKYSEYNLHLRHSDSDEDHDDEVLTDETSLVDSKDFKFSPTFRTDEALVVRRRLNFQSDSSSTTLQNGSVACCSMSLDTEGTVDEDSQDDDDDEPSEPDDGTRHADLSSSEMDELDDEQAHRHNVLLPNGFDIDGTVMIVGAALSTLQLSCSHPAPKTIGKQISIQTNFIDYNPTSVQTLVQEKRQVDTQTRIEFAEMERYTSPPLSITTYTQTQDVPEITSVLQSHSKFDEESHLPIGELSQAFGHSILETFGRKCNSMHNISDWNASKFCFLTNYEGSSYQRKFSHAEALLYTVMCQDSSFQPNSVMPLTSDIRESRGQSQSRQVTETVVTQQGNQEHRFVSDLPGTTPLILQESATSDAETETLDFSLTPFPAESITSFNSDGNSSSNSAGSSGYNADDELSEDDEPPSRRARLENNNEPANLPTAHRTQDVRRHRRLPNRAVHRGGQHGLATVAHVLPLVSGAVIKRIIKRGELKPTMSDYS